MAIWPRAWAIAGTLELLLTAGPWIERPAQPGGQVSLELDRRGGDGAEGLHCRLRPGGGVPDALDRRAAAIGQAYADVGMRAVLAPMVADISFYDAIPGLMERLPPGAAEGRRAAAARAVQGAASPQMKKVLHGWKLDRRGVSLGRGADHPASLHARVPARLPEARQGLRYWPAQPRCGIKVQVIAGYQLYGTTLGSLHGFAWAASGRTSPSAHGVWLDDDDMKLLGD